MIEIFAYIGIAIVILIGITIVSGMIGLIHSDRDAGTRWFIAWFTTCILYSITTTLFIMALNK